MPYKKVKRWVAGHHKYVRGKRVWVKGHYMWVTIYVPRKTRK